MWDLLGAASYMAHGFCLLWEPWLIALYAGSDALIFLAYAAIPIALLRFLRLRPDVGYPHLVALFAAFILLCGLTHLVSIVTLWYPVYALHGFAKLLTGGVSLATAAVLFPLVPVVARIPSPTSLQHSNDQLRAEIAAHEETTAALRDAKINLEIRVAERTAELRSMNDRLALSSREAVHRAKNTLAIVQSLVNQTARTSVTAEDMAERLGGRLVALAGAMGTVLPGASGPAADLRDVIGRQLAAQISAHDGQITLDGPPLVLAEDRVQQIALALHELATNAAKYGALSRPGGCIGVSWSETAPDQVCLLWHERSAPDGGAPPAPAEGGGFGTVLLTRAIPAQLGGTARQEFATGEMTYRLEFPLNRKA
jgi:two-component sensor histidine kinase